jgi:hypothetical protein
VTGFAALMAFLEQFLGALGQRLGRMIGEEDTKRVVIVDRNPGMAAQIGEFRLRRHQ